MTKKSIITLSIILAVIALIGVLFGAVFCLRKQNVIFLDNSSISVSGDEIISTAELKKGQSIFMIDKDSAISKIESTYAKIKVVQIKTVSLFEINICVRARHEMYYTEYGNKYYILDEELKVLDITEDSNQASNLTHIEAGALNIDSLTLVCDFVGDSYQRDVAYNLFVAMNTSVTKEGTNGEEYLTRGDIRELLENIKFEKFDTFNKIVITTNYGVKLDIESPQKDMSVKIYNCFKVINGFIKNENPQENEKAKKGTIRIFYNLQNEMKCVYISE